MLSVHQAKLLAAQRTVCVCACVRACVHVCVCVCVCVRARARAGAPYCVDNHYVYFYNYLSSVLLTQSHFHYVHNTYC